MAKALPRGVREKNGSYEARAECWKWGRQKKRKMTGIHWIIEKQESH